MAECAPEEDKTERPQQETAPVGKQKSGAIRPFLNNAHQAHPLPKVANYLELPSPS